MHRAVASSRGDWTQVRAPSTPHACVYWRVQGATLGGSFCHFRPDKNGSNTTLSWHLRRKLRSILATKLLHHWIMAWLLVLLWVAIMKHQAHFATNFRVWLRHPAMPIGNCKQLSSCGALFDFVLLCGTSLHSQFDLHLSIRDNLAFKICHAQCLYRRD